MPLIKRYPNRKLYDTESKRYVSLADVAGFIRQGAEVQVVDHVTGDDLTALTLMQIIVEQEKHRSDYLPRSVVAGLLQAGGDTLTALRRVLVASADLMRQVDDEIARRIQALIQAGDLDAEEGERLFGKLVALGSRVTVGDWAIDQVVKRVASAHGVPTRSDLQPLYEQIEALEAELVALSAASDDRLPL